MPSSNDRTLVILGATGDLTARLLLPGLGALLASAEVERLQLVGSAQEAWDDDRWRSHVAESFAEEDASGPQVDAVISNTHYVQSDVTDENDLRRLLDSCSGELILYFALPPVVTEKVCRVLTGLELPEGTHLAIEKPFGSDADSAVALNDLVTQLVPEDRVHRIDHFVAMSTVLNILGLRFANRIIEPVLNNQHVRSVDVVFDESLTLEGRARFYDATGALVDMIQSHLLEVLALFAMEPVPTLEAEDVRDAKAQVLRATRVWDDDPISYSRRARYTAGEIDGREVPSYVEEDGIDGSRRTETFAELVLAVDTWRWAGVPFRVRSGKALGSPSTEVTVTFEPPRQVPAGMKGNVPPNRLHIGIPLGANMFSLDLNISGPGDPFEVDPVSVAGTFGAGQLPHYGQVLLGIIEREPPLSVRGDMAVECWRIIEPVRRAWRENRVPLGEYRAGSPGPSGWSHTGLPGEGI
ncbi:glucose-6-phosphate dehydrogenase [Rhodococcus sp. NPDC058521]|uniref:glucose-6-phosphate dehydrogenase n=1 Tax=Rhodococcus sp. NPDC058521 TaxID=3346536 RepID=UPI003662928F